MADPQNWVREAVARLDGPTRVANLLGISGTHVHRMMKQGRMPTDTEEARARIFKVAELSGVSAAKLAGLYQPKGGRVRETACSAHVTASSHDSAGAASGPAMGLGFALPPVGQLVAA